MNNSFSFGKIQYSLVELTRYIFIGIITNLVGYLFYLFITSLGATPKLTMTALYFIGATLGYIGNKKLTFTHTGDLLGSSIRYFIAHGFGYIVNLGILIIFVDHMGYKHQWVQAAAVFIVASFLFVLFKFFVFSNKHISGDNKK